MERLLPEEYVCGETVRTNPKGIVLTTTKPERNTNEQSKKIQSVCDISEYCHLLFVTRWLFPRGSVTTLNGTSEVQSV